MALGNLKAASTTIASAEELKKIRSDIFSLFSRADMQQSVNILNKYHIDYVYVGPNERAYSGDGCAVYYEGKEYFKIVYSRMGVDIFQYRENEGALRAETP